MQRLFSTFPCGLPGAGLVLLRLLVAIPLLHAGWQAASEPVPAMLELVLAGAALFLLIGLWTSPVGKVISTVELWLAWAHSADPWTRAQLAALGAALLLLGPGGGSVDARLFGRKQIDIPER